MTVRFIPELAGITPYQPGLPIEVVQRRFGLERVVKLASNEFPLPPFPEVKAVVMGALDRLQRYPDGFSTDLREALAAIHDRSPEQITIGCGTCELLYLLAHAMLERGDEVVLAAPSFTSYRDVIDIRGAVPVTVPLVDYTHDLDAMAAAVTPRTRMVFVCNPNNPTGTYLPSAEVARLVERVPDDVMVVLDEAYIEFVTAEARDGSLEIQKAHDNVVVLRTFSKIYGLCGLRTGYGICAPEVKQAVDKVRQPFNVNLLGQLAATEALKHPDQVAERRETNARLRDLLVERLAERGRATVPSQANFMLVDIDGLRVPQDEVCGTLLSMGAIVRDGNALGCPGWARVTVGTEEEIEFLLDKLARLEAGSGTPGEGRRL
jgi:histidinol-phosphate aminotransferase